MMIQNSGSNMELKSFCSDYELVYIYPTIFWAPSTLYTTYTIYYNVYAYSIFNILYSIFYILYFIFYILYFMFYTLHSMSMCVSIYILFWILLSSQNIFLHRQWSTFWPTSFQKPNTSVVIFTGNCRLIYKQPVEKATAKMKFSRIAVCPPHLLIFVREQTTITTVVYLPSS